MDKRDKHGNVICRHNRTKTRCKDCGGGSVCLHGVLRTVCKECGGGSFCAHGVIKGQCKKCSPGRQFKVYKFSAKQKGLDFTISKSEFLGIILLPCVYCGCVSGGMDRVNNLKGYTQENAVPCCGFCNLMKKDHSIEKFLNQIRKIYSYSNLRDSNVSS